jgi:hypothetical protein
LIIKAFGWSICSGNQWSNSAENALITKNLKVKKALPGLAGLSLNQKCSEKKGKIYLLREAVRNHFVIELQFHFLKKKYSPLIHRAGQGCSSRCGIVL